MRASGFGANVPLVRDVRSFGNDSHWPVSVPCVISRAMNGPTPLQITAICFTNACLLASMRALDPAKQPPLPEKPIAVKKELLFSDDFKGADRDKRWHRVVDTFTFENGALKGTQTRDQNIPATDGKPEVKAHAAVYGLELPTKDSVIEAKIRFDGATMIDVEFDDRKFTGSHYGHIARAQAKLNGVTILDEREGTQSGRVVELKKDMAANKGEIDKIVAAHSITYPAQLEAGKTYLFCVETVGDEMRVSIDGKVAAFLKSDGIGHTTKSKIELGVAGKSGWFEDIKVWNAEKSR